LLVVASLAAYAVAPSGEAVAADAREEPARPGKEAIKGTAPRGTEIRVLKRTPNGRRPIAKRVVGASGRFSIEVRAGRYLVVIERSDSSKRLAVRVKRGHSIFIEVEVSKGPGGSIIAPVVFNY